MSIPLFQQSEATAERARLYFHAVDATDGIAAETGLTGTGYVSKNGGTPAASTNSLVEIDSTNMPGRYYITLTATELNTVGFVEFRYKAAACAEVVARAQVVGWDPWDTSRLGLSLPSDIHSRLVVVEAAIDSDQTSRTTAIAAVKTDTSDTHSRLVVVEAAIDSDQTSRTTAIAAVKTDTSDTHSRLVVVEASIDSDQVSRTTAIAAVKSDTTAIETNADAAISTRATPADVNTQCVDVLYTDTFTEPSQGIPAATQSIADAIAYFWAAFRNKETQTASEYAVYNDAGTQLAKATVSDDATTVTKAEMVSGA